MRTPLDEALSSRQELPDMNQQGPSNPLGNRPRMAEALASLKEGLRDTADPLYDGWRVRPPLPNEAKPAVRPQEAAPPPVSVDTGAAVAKPGEAIDISLEGTPDQTAAFDPTEPPPSVEALPGEPFLTIEEEFFIQEELNEPTEEPTVVLRPSVQTDTVRVRVIRYPAFPRWALIVAAALSVFAVSLVALRAGLPRDAARGARSVLASEVPAGFAAPSAAVAATPPAPLSHPLAAPVVPSHEAPTPQSDPGVGSGFDAPSTTDSPSTLVQSPAPTGKMPAAPARRRQGAHDFFRDPGF